MIKALNKDSIFNDEQYTCSSYNEDTNEESFIEALTKKAERI